MSKSFREFNIVRALALVPLLIATTSLSSALLIALISCAIYLLTAVVFKFRQSTDASTLQWLLAIIIAATVGALVDLYLQAFAWKFYALIGGYLPFIALSAVFVTQTENTQRADPAEIAKIVTAVIGFGALRELIGTGAIFNQLEILLGINSNSWRIGFSANDRGFLLAILPAGALISIGLLIAAKNYLTNSTKPESPVAPVKNRRVRVTGPVS